MAGIVSGLFGALGSAGAAIGSAGEAIGSAIAGGAGSVGSTIGAVASSKKAIPIGLMGLGGGQTILSLVGTAQEREAIDEAGVRSREQLARRVQQLRGEQIATYARAGVVPSIGSPQAMGEATQYAFREDVEQLVEAVTQARRNALMSGLAGAVSGLGTAAMGAYSLFNSPAGKLADVTSGAGWSQQGQLDLTSPLLTNPEFARPQGYSLLNPNMFKPR